MRESNFPSGRDIDAGRRYDPLHWLRRCAGVLAVLCCLIGLGAKADAQTAAREPLPPKVEELLKLLAEPSVQQWLEAQRRAQAEPAAQPAAMAPAPANEMAMGGRLAQVRRHLLGVIGAFATLPSEFMHARADMMASMQQAGVPGLFPLIFAFIGFGFGLQWLYVLATRRFAAGIAALPVATPRERLTAITASLAYDVGRLAAFALGSVGAFLAFEWPSLFRDVALVYLAAAVAIGAARAVLLALLSPPWRKAHPDPEALRIVPLDAAGAAFWTRRLFAAIVVFGVGYATIRGMARHGFPIESQFLIAYIFGLGLLAIGIAAVWRAPPSSNVNPRLRPVVVKWLLTLYFIALWSLWALHAMRLFWLAVVAVALPAAIMLVQPCIARVLRTEADAGGRPSSIAAACVERGIRAVFIVLAVLLLAWAWNVHLVAMTQADTFTVRALRGLMSAVIVLMIADFLWHIVRTAIDLKIAEAAKLGEQGSDEAHKRGRLRTLLPILRIALMVLIGTVAVLTALASLGVQIAPLIAGAGVVGVAVGFGSQTLVRDIMSGMFYLLDDAFRVGEYIIAGNYKGTVESFSLRSVRLRHHNGPIYTVPFGVLGAVQNTSRDWVVEKFTIGVTYDTDVEKARKIVKKIGLELAEDPEFKNSVIEPLKMQGVDAFGDYAIKLRLKVMTKPNEQYGIKRRALVRIKQAFEENGIKFASPTVQVAGAASPAEVAAASVALKPAVAAE